VFAVTNTSGPKMRRCIIFRLSVRPVSGEEAEHENEASEMDEKRVSKPRNWSAIFLTAIRFLQLAYFTFAYFALFGFQRSSYFHHGAWQPSPNQRHHSKRTMHWVRTQVWSTQ
jgi:hypothetical protein